MIHGQRGKALDSNADGLGLITTETDFPQADFGPGTTVGLLVTQAESGAIAAAPSVNASRLPGTDRQNILSDQWEL